MERKKRNKVQPLFKHEFDDKVDALISDLRPPDAKPVKGSEPKPVAIKQSRGRSKPPMDPDAEFAIDKGRMEVQLIESKINELLTDISGLALYPYLEEHIRYLKDYVDGLSQLMTREFKQDKLSARGWSHLQQLQKRKAEVLSDIFNKYHEKI